MPCIIRCRAFYFTQEWRKDKDITKMLLQAGRIMDIKMVDHIIVAGETGEMYSFQREGLMDQLEWEKAGWER